jgi:hypothetical protein
MFDFSLDEVKMDIDEHIRRVPDSIALFRGWSLECNSSLGWISL